MTTSSTLTRHLANLPPLLRYHEVAELCRVDVRTVRRWCKEGRLAKVRIGRRSLIPREEIVELLTPKNET